MNIFAADLDRTLLFSQARLDPAGPPTVPVEYRQGDPFGFMTPAAQGALETIATRTSFFVNTLRGLEQAMRVRFVAQADYLALQNGLYLYRRGKEDVDWSAHVRATVAALPLDLPGGIARVLASLPGIERLSKQYQYLAVFFVEETAFDDDACAQLAGELAQSGWTLCRQRKKLYLWPTAIDKGAVLDRVRQWENGAETIAFGDSAFDLPMLRASDTAWSLAGCELDGRDWGFPLRFSQAPAQEGTEEILYHILGVV